MLSLSALNRIINDTSIKSTQQIIEIVKTLFPQIEKAIVDTASLGNRDSTELHLDLEGLDESTVVSDKIKYQEIEDVLNKAYHPIYFEVINYHTTWMAPAYLSLKFHIPENPADDEILGYNLRK